MAVVKTAQRIAGASLPAIEDIYKKRCLKRATNITRDSYHPAHRLFALLPSGRHYRSLPDQNHQVQIIVWIIYCNI
ncbi:hypothetical protein N1851_030346 [Merluccius polli]|uniref:Uncharacterized protein n=1 Tax=Merluccius polli TaxID=89951 RepID=A0AA47M5P3_MERPO|nr:hypothetical protein N1851_030346 [Merluccius polli]